MGNLNRRDTFSKEVTKSIQAVSLNWGDYVETDEKYYRPNEVNHLLGDSTKAKKLLGWYPETSFEELVNMMVQSDLELAQSEKVLVDKKLMLPTWENPT